MEEINDNIIYFTAYVLDPRIKTTLIREQYSNAADELILRIRTYLKKEFSSSAPITTSYGAPVIPVNASLY